MGIIITRADKGAPLTWDEVDNNFVELQDLVIAAAPSAAAAAASAAAALVSQNAAAASEADAEAAAALAVPAAAAAVPAAATAVSAAATSTTNALTATAQAALALAAQIASASSASLAIAAAAQAQSVVQQDLSGVTAAALHRSPNAVVAMCLYNVDKDSDPSWPDRCTNTSWFNEALNGTYLPGGFASEMDARDYFGTLSAASIVTGDSSNFAGGLGSWVAVDGNGGPSYSSGRMRLTLTAALGNVCGASLAMTTVIGQRYQIAVRYEAANIANQNAFLYVGTAAGGATIGSLNMGISLGARYLSFVATGTTTYLTVSGSTAWPQNGYVEVDDITVKPVSFAANPSGVFYQLSTDGKFYRPWKNLFSNSGLTGGTAGAWGSGAVAPTGWGVGIGTGSISFSASTRYTGANSIRFTAAAERPYLTQTVAFAVGGSYTFSGYVETLHSGTAPISRLFGGAAFPAGTVASYRKNGVVAAAGDLVATGDFIEIIYTGMTAAGTPSLRYGAGADANATVDVTMSPPMIEVGLAATAYELKTGTDGAQVETFRGNKAKFPRLAGIVAEAASVTIYDLTEPGRPMWMRFVATSLRMVTTSTVSCVSMTHGVLSVGNSAGTGGVALINFPADNGVRLRNSTQGFYGSGNGRWGAGISKRNDLNAWDGAFNLVAFQLPSDTVNAVAMTVLPDAPVDPLTGLQVPTIAVATAGGISIIQNDGTVRNSSNTFAYMHILLTKDLLLVGHSSSAYAYYALKPGNLGASFAFTAIIPAAAPGFNDLIAAITGTAQGGRSMFAARQGTRLALMRLHEATNAQSLAAHIAPTYATGYWCGDIRRCWLADTVAGAVAATELIPVAADRDFSSDTGFWTKQTGITIGGGVCAYTAAAGTTALYRPGLAPATPGRVFSVTFTVTGYSGGGVACNLGGGPNGTLRSANGTYTEEIAAGTNGVVQFFANGTTTLNIDDISITEKVADRSYKSKGLTIYGTLTRTAVASAAQLVAYSGWSGSNYAQEAYSSDLDPALAAVTCSAWINYTTAVASTIVERAAASGARIVLGTDGTGKLTATAYDGTTTRTVTTTAAYNTTTWLKARGSYTTDGTLSISVNGRTVASTYGAPLLTLSNASAVCTIGNDRTLATPFPGSIALVKWGATVPTQEQALWMYEQEKQMFRAGAQVTLPTTNILLDVAYDDMTDTITVVDSGNEASFTGLVRTSTATVPAGTYSKAARGSGVKMLARITTTPGVDVTIPSQNLKEELKRTEDAARRARLPMTFDYVGGFTGNVTSGSTAIASVTGLSVPSTVNLRGVTVTGTGIPASTVITDIVGSTVYISKAATATNTGVSISMLSFPLPSGYEVEGVKTAGIDKQEGATKDWTRSYDGFIERPDFPALAPPGTSAWVQVKARRAA